MDAEQKKAVARLKKLRVYGLLSPWWSREEEATFDDWWFLVAHETDMFEQEEESMLDIRSFKSARKWMDDTEHLLSEAER